MPITAIARRARSRGSLARRAASLARYRMIASPPIKRADEPWAKLSSTAISSRGLPKKVLTELSNGKRASPSGESNRSLLSFRFDSLVISIACDAYRAVARGSGGQCG